MQKFLEGQFISFLFPKTTIVIIFITEEDISDEDIILSPVILTVTILFDILMILFMPIKIVYKIIKWLRFRNVDQTYQK